MAILIPSSRTKATICPTRLVEGFTSDKIASVIPLRQGRPRVRVSTKRGLIVRIGFPVCTDSTDTPPVSHLQYRGMYSCLSAVIGFEKANRFFRDCLDRVDTWVPLDIVDFTSLECVVPDDDNESSTNCESVDSVVFFFLC
jgi:hypothetical protein